MNTSNILFDAPGPKAVVRHRVYTVLTILALVGFVLAVLLRLDRNGQLAYALWEPFVTPEYVQAIWGGLLDTLKMAFSAIIGALVFGLVFGVGKMSEHRWLRWPSWVVVEFFRAVPVLLMMIFLYFAYGLGKDAVLSSYWCVVIALTVYNGAVLAEVFRAGVLAVPRGQAEAAYAVGMRKAQVMNLVLLPQAVKIMLPSIISQCVVALKDTALGYYISSPGLTFVGKQIYGEFQNQVQVAIVITAIYVVVNLILSAIATWVQKRIVGEKKALAPTPFGITDADTGATQGGGRI
ncbi:amino acid ABC transporter permease [Nocardioides guangzhouensis]|uniref:Amino acid ABC transporter permease n=1 Tax=Nocardioides guangzhouensis TaxID=2497878 RepID=A0A4Q4ZHJ1_9ACTN|nr:amino acid ABC transporter permease [Nocardioides guangzhouensis]RYP86906.1 amino acid ABC transporter permease [Nocardioides guangzhouensis]